MNGTATGSNMSFNWPCRASCASARRRCGTWMTACALLHASALSWTVGWHECPPPAAHDVLCRLAVYFH